METGTRLGPYEVVALLGAGGMGEVYRARDTRLDRDVAVKVIHSRFAADAERLSRFEQEAKAAAKLDHPNILVVHDVGSHEGSPYIVSELLEGESLREMLGSPLPPRKAVEYALEIARGLSAAHGKGIIHRDLKPENVFVTKDGRVKILDFGVAKLTQPSSGGPLDTEATTAAATEPGVVLGTVGYMSPEQVLGKPLDARSDLFSLGAVLYEMLSGKRPFHRGTAPETLAAILREEPPDLAETNKNISPELERIVRRCLEKEPARRFQSAGEVIFDLETVSGQLGTKPVAPMSAAGVFLHRHRAGVAAAALLVAIAVGAGWWWKTRSGPGAVGMRLAVLPFENLTGDPEQAYLADGIHESLITDLARLSGFSRVIARPSVMSYAKTTKRLADVGKELGVDTLVTGSVMRAAAKLKVTAHLIRAGTEEHVWSESYEREPRDILSLQNEIVRSIAQKAKLTLTPAEQNRLAAARPVSPEAYEAYLKGKYQLNKMTPEGFEKALAYLNQAAEMDPTNPLPQSALALAYARMGHERFPDFFARARKAVARAQELGGEPLAEMYQALGMTKLYSDWDYEGAAKDFRRAMELNPSLGDPHRDYSWYLHLVGRRPEALAEMKRAQELEPLTPLFFADRGWQLWWGGKNDEALAEARKSLDLDPKFAYGRAVVGYVLAEKGRFEEAIAEHRKAGEDDADWRWCVTRTYAQAGRKDEARKALAKFLGEKPEATGDWAGWFLAETYAALGENDKAIRWLEECYRKRFSFLPWIDQNPAYAPLRSDPRFEDLVRRMKAPQG
ncbi:MAG: protein kinase domain-containing protein [Thermoanaerobaculia bacterium]